MQLCIRWVYLEYETLWAAWLETCCAFCSAWQRCSPQHGSGFVVPVVGAMRGLPSLVAGSDIRAGKVHWRKASGE